MIFSVLNAPQPKKYTKQVLKIIKMDKKSVNFY